MSISVPVRIPDLKEARALTDVQGHGNMWVLKTDSKLFDCNPNLINALLLL